MQCKLMKGVAAAAGLLAVASAQNAPAIEADGSDVIVNAQELSLVNADGVPIRMTGIVSNIVSLQEESEHHETEFAEVLSRLTALEAENSWLMQNVGNITSSVASLQQGMADAIAQATSYSDDLRQDMDTEVDGITRMLSTLSESVANTSATDALAQQQQELQQMIHAVRNPRRQIVEGNWVRGDDRRSVATCPEGLLPTSCRIERMPTDLGGGQWTADGLIMIEPDTCHALAHVHGGTIRVSLECTDLHMNQTLISHDDWTRDKTIDCPAGYRALHCMCWSAWGNCQGDSWGYSPESNTRCHARRSGSGRHRLSAICIGAQ